MKYNEELFNISSQLYSKVDKTSEDNHDMEIKLLKILLTKIKDTIDNNQKENNGILKFKFISRVFGNTDEGYILIEKLIKLNKIYSFANDYCIYMDCKKYSDDLYYSTYYEIVWDFKTYFESLNAEKNNIQKRK